jgi:hypothetical protein
MSRSNKSYPSFFFIAFACFLHRLLILLKFKCSPNLLCLSTGAVGWIYKRSGLLREALRLKKINDILSVACTEIMDCGWARRRLLSNIGIDEISRRCDKINASGGKLISAELQLAFWNSFPDLLGRIYSENTLLDTEKHHGSILWSSLEVLAKANAIGAQSVMEAVGPAWVSYPLTVRVLVAFRALHDKAFATARHILEVDFTEVRKMYGTSSMEFVVVGTQLAHSYNALAMELEAERMVAEMVWAIWSKRQSGSINVEDVPLLRSVPDIYLFVAYSDSLIGQGLYERAKALLREITSRPVMNNDTALLCLLRLLKINRRQAQDSIPENWTFLDRAIGLLNGASSDALYQCFEEAICMLSAIDNLDTTQISRAKDVIGALDVIDTTQLHGSDTMKLTLQEYQQELKLYRRDFGLFSVTGPQEHYCRNIREGFPKASVAFVERIGAANWERFQRLTEMPYLDDVVEPVVTVAPSNFHDSAVGSSIQSSALPTAIPPPFSKARSKLSMNTTPGPGLSGLLEVPPEIMAGEPYQCEWCGKSLKMVDPNHQWP